MSKLSQMTDLRRTRRRRFLFATLLLPLVVAGGIFSYSAGGFLDHLHRFNLAVKDGDQDLAEKELPILRDYHSSAATLKMLWLVDGYAPGEFYLRDAVIKFMVGDYDAVITDPMLRVNLDDHLVSQLVGSAKFRKAEALYNMAETRDEKDQVVVDSTNGCEDFRRAAENGPGPQAYFAHSLNFDICVSPEATRRAFENTGPPRVKLGTRQPPGDKNSDQLDPKMPGGGSRSRRTG